jgi:hypothetical protein
VHESFFFKTRNCERSSGELVLVNCSKEGRNQTCLKGDRANLFRRGQVLAKERLFIS